MRDGRLRVVLAKIFAFPSKFYLLKVWLAHLLKILWDPGPGLDTSSFRPFRLSILVSLIKVDSWSKSKSTCLGVFFIESKVLSNTGLYKKLLVLVWFSFFSWLFLSFSCFSIQNLQFCMFTFSFGTLFYYQHEIYMRIVWTRPWNFGCYINWIVKIVVLGSILEKFLYGSGFFWQVEIRVCQQIVLACSWRLILLLVSLNVFNPRRSFTKRFLVLVRFGDKSALRLESLFSCVVFMVLIGTGNVFYMLDSFIKIKCFFKLGFLFCCHLMFWCASRTMDFLF